MNTFIKDGNFVVEDSIITRIFYTNNLNDKQEAEHLLGALKSIKNSVSFYSQDLGYSHRNKAKIVLQVFNDSHNIGYRILEESYIFNKYTDNGFIPLSIFDIDLIISNITIYLKNFNIQEVVE